MGHGYLGKPSTSAARIIKALLCTLAAVTSTYALGQKRYVEFTLSPGAIRLGGDGVAAPIIVDSRDYPGVLRAAHDLQTDIERVTKIRPAVIIDAPAPPEDVIIIGTLGKNRLIDRLVGRAKLDVAAIRGRWESFLIQVVAQPWPGVKRALVIIGSDKRGSIYGLYDVSEQIGVSPWYWWADVPVTHRDQLFVRAGRYVQGEPTVKYRGVFINDEAPALTGWVREKFGTYNHQFYEKVFELLLRLKANYLWPAMWNNAFNDDDPLNPKLADEYGIVMGTSHHEPMLRAQQEWKRHGEGAWDYATNGDALRQFWSEGIRGNRNYESIITLGMRGDGDLPMSAESNVAVLERIVSDQRKILAENVNPDLAAVPQLWALYKEVQDYYEKGMRVPDDVTLLWCDDNWGNIRRLPATEERKRSGGAGVYYHFDYVGGPRSYKWLNTVPITKIWEQMNLAYRHGATRIWIVNVGDIKPMEFPSEFFLNLAWDPERWTAESLTDYTRLWSEREFGPEHASEIAEIIDSYTKYNGRRKPELLEPLTYSLVNYREAETVVSDYQHLAQQAEKIYLGLPPERKDSFFQLVLYPVKACAVLNELNFTVGKNRMYAVQGRAATNDLVERALSLFREDEKLSRYYNQTLAGGKWNHLMDQTHIGYTFWNQPVRNAMPAIQEIQIPAQGEMSVAVEGSEAAWPDSPHEAVLPALNVYDRQPRYFEVFNRGNAPFTFTAEATDPWLRLSVSHGTVAREQRIWVSVDWDAVPAGDSRASITINGPNDRKVGLTVPLVNPGDPKRDTVEGFVETNGCVSIEAEHFTRSVEPNGMRWQRIPDFGRTLSGMTPFPATASSQNLSPNGMRLEYQMYLFHDGPVSVDTYLAPTQKFLPGAGFRYAISFDDETPQVINIHASYAQAEWERSVKDGVRILKSKHTLAQPGYHTLKFWVIDPGLVLEKLLVDTGGVRPSYLGPPESFRGTKDSTSAITFAQSLREQADKNGLLIGAAVNPALFSEASYASTLAREFNMVEPENVMKWGAIRPAQDKFNFGPADEVVAFAQAHKMKVRGHCLLWSEHNPAWLSKGSFTAEQLSKLLREHITTAMKHYSGRVFAWDVVNEAFLANGNIEPSIWYDSPGIGLAGKGTAYVEQAFRWARAADPKALLFYNDYDTEGLNAKSDAVYAMVKDFRKRGVPIDGVGIQAHIFNPSMKEISSLAANISRLTALGVQVHITEMDVALPLDATGALLDQASLARQADVYRFVATACLQQPGCTAFQTWGFTDKYSWIPGFTKGAKGRALLFDQSYAPKPAYNALREVLERERRRKTTSSP